MDDLEDSKNCVSTFLSRHLQHSTGLTMHYHTHVIHTGGELQIENKLSYTDTNDSSKVRCSMEGERG
jgi:hypothetical protein